MRAIQRFMMVSLSYRFAPIDERRPRNIPDGGVKNRKPTSSFVMALEHTSPDVLAI
jgi:hypothetical protein